MKIKKVLALLLSLLIIFSFAGCMEEEEAAPVDNITNGVDLFNTLSKDANYQSYTFSMALSWVIPNIGSDDEVAVDTIDSSDESTGIMGEDNTQQTVSSTESLLNTLLKNKMSIEGVVVKTDDGMNVSADLTIVDKTFKLILVDNVCYIGAKELLNNALGGELLKTEYISISKSSIETILSTASTSMSTITGTPTDASSSDIFGSSTTIDTTGGALTDLGGIKIPEISIKKLSGLLTPLYNGLKQTFASKQFDVFSVDNEGFNTMKITDKEVLLVVKNTLTQYRNNSTDIYAALQTIIKDWNLSDTVSFSQEELDKALDDAIITAQDAIDLDELDGTNFSFVVKAKADDNSNQKIFDFDVQKDSKQYSFEIDLSKTNDSSVTVTAPSDTATIESVLFEIIPNIDLNGDGGNLITEPEDPGEEVTIW